MYNKPASTLTKYSLTHHGCNHNWKFQSQKRVLIRTFRTGYWYLEEEKPTKLWNETTDYGYKEITFVCFVYAQITGEFSSSVLPSKLSSSFRSIKSPTAALPGAVLYETSRFDDPDVKAGDSWPKIERCYSKKNIRFVVIMCLWSIASKGLSISKEEYVNREWIVSISFSIHSIPQSWQSFRKHNIPFALLKVFYLDITAQISF